MRIVVIGAHGRLAQAVVQAFDGHEVFAFGHRELDVEVEAQATARILAVAPHAVINCAAYNDVDRAEDEALRAIRINALGVRVLAEAARRADAVLVHYGSDFVFDGHATSPYDESHHANPLSVYGASKFAGEQFALASPRSYVLRVESLFGRVDGGADTGSVAAILAKLQAGDVPRVFADRTVSPSYVFDVAAATRRLIELNAPFGLYHCANTGWCTWAELATEVARQLGVAARLDLVRTVDVVLRAPRPRYCALSNAKLAQIGIAMPTWQDAVARHVQARLGCGHLPQSSASSRPSAPERT